MIWEADRACPLGAGSPSLASRVLSQVPPAVISGSAESQAAPPVSTSQINEYLDYTSLFDALRMHLQFTEVWSHRPDTDGAPKTEQMRFSQALQKITEQLWNTFTELLTSEWLLIEAIDEDVELQFLNGGIYFSLI
jgi:hypothetical protein